MDPTEDKRKAMAMKDVFRFAGLDESQMADERTIPGSLAVLLGTKPETRPSVLGMLSEAEFNTALRSWKAPCGGSARLPTHTKVGTGKLIGHTCDSWQRPDSREHAESR